MLLPKSFIGLIAGLLLIMLGAGVWHMARYYLESTNICKSKPVDELLRQYPQLAQLQLRHRQETMQLLDQQQAQDFLLGLQLQKKSEQANQIAERSKSHIDTLADMRERQREEFLTLCRDLVDRQ